MGVWCRRGVAVAALAVVVSACNSTAPGATVTGTAGATASTTNAAGAMAGFLAAAAAQDNRQVPLWLATTTDTADLNEVLNVYNSFGTDTHGGLFWAVHGVAITAVNGGDPTHANVTLSDDIVWCLGRAPNDPTATCSAVNGVPGHPHTYAAVSGDGRWKVDVDINASSQLDQNPQASPTAGAPTASPT